MREASMPGHAGVPRTGSTERTVAVLLLMAALVLALLPAANEAVAEPIARPAAGSQHLDEDRQYPFLCTVEEEGLGQPVIDNDGTESFRGIPVYKEDADGEPIRDEDHIIGYSRDCELAGPTYDYYYVDEDGDRHHLWSSGDDPVTDPPEDLATTVTTDGVEVDHLIRQERGTSNRFIYSITMLVPWDEVASGDPSEPQHDSWNGKLTFSFDGGVGIGHSQGSFSNAAAFLDFDGGGHTRDVDALARGYAVATSSGLRTGVHYDLEVGARTAEALKDHFISKHGEPQYTIGIGSSGGAIQQYVYGEHSSGLIDAAVPVRGYPDMHTQAIHIGDCELLERYMDIDAAEAEDLWDDLFEDQANRQLIQGLNASAELGSTECVEGWRGLMPLALNPHLGSAPGLDRLTPEEIDSIEWTHWDDALQVYGVDDDGFARVPWDNVGVQYGLGALTDGEISPEQFLDLNARVGTWKESADMVPHGDVTGRPDMRLADEAGVPAPRKEGDSHAIESAYDSGLFFSGDIAIPVIDARQYLEGELDMHNSHQSFAARQRIIDAIGHADHHVVWFFGDDRGAQTQLQHAFDVMDEWLANIDTGQDLVEAKPSSAVDTCWDNDGDVIASGDDVWAGVLDDGPQGECTSTYPPFTTSRIEAGGPITGDVWKCRTMPVETAVHEGIYGDWEPSEDNLSRLQEIFPDGVCDYGLPGVGDPRAEVPGPVTGDLRGRSLHVEGTESGATVELRRDGEVIATATATPRGRAVIPAVESGTYVLAQSVDGQRGLLSDPVTIEVPGSEPRDPSAEAPGDGRPR